MNPEQRKIYNEIVNSIDNQDGSIYLIDAVAGTGKTFLLNALLAYVKLKDIIYFASATSGLAASLLHGQTIHRTYGIPVPLKDSHGRRKDCKINSNSYQAKKLRQAGLHVVDEALSCHNSILNMVYDIWWNESKCVKVVCGDPFQILPIIRNGTRADQINATIWYSKFKHLLKKRTLRTNMRMRNFVSQDNDFIVAFSKYLLQLRTGNIPALSNEVYQVLGLDKSYPDIIPIPPKIISDSLNALIDHAYPDFENSIHLSSSAKYFADHILMSPTHETNNYLNMTLFNRMRPQNIDHDDTVLAMSEDILSSDSNVYMPLCNLNTSAQIQNGTRFILIAHDRVRLTGRILTGPMEGEIIHFPRIRSYSK